MRINKLEITNFRCFEHLEINLNQKCNVLVGINGAGKSSLLDALSIALGGYLAGFDNIKSNSIAQVDAHYKMYAAGSRVERQAQFPVVVSASASIGEEPVNWQRELYGEGRRTTHGNLKEVTERARGYQDRVRKGEADCILPLVAYYGTGRLWLQKINRVKHKSSEVLSRQKGYVDCIAAESNDKQMMQWFEDMTYIQLQEGRELAELEAVKKALRQCYMSASKAIKNARFSYDVKSHELEILIEREDSVEKFPVRMLSDGEKGVISLVADIAYRMALLNPNLLDRVLETPGVILIDEIDMHLHPAWQKKIIGDLISIFPNIQFVVTTHSPSVLVNVPREYVWILDSYHLYQPNAKTFGRTVEEILREIMGVNVRPDKILELQHMFDQAIDDGDYKYAKVVLEEMRELLGENAVEVIENQITLDVELIEELE